MKLTHTVTALLGLLATASAHAGYSTGKVGNVVVGRQGYQVFIELISSEFTSWPCATTHPNGFRYAFMLNSTAGKEMLATVLTAQATGQHLQVIGKASCSIDATLEDVDYVVLRP